MTSNKQETLVPSEAAEEAESPAGEANRPGEQIPIVPAGGLPIAPLSPQTTRAPVEAAGEAADLWSNGRWAVTEAGLESRYAVDGRPIEYLIDKKTLLKILPRTAISMWAEQLAQKTWLDDPEAMVEALAEALRRHHPGQAVIDIEATREHARHEWRRVQHRERNDILGYDYKPGEPTLRRLARRDLEAQARTDLLGATDGGEPPEEPWVDPIVNRIRIALATHGVDPSAHPGAAHVNPPLVLMAMAFATNDQLLAAADRLKEEHILNDDEPEDEIPEEVEDEIEEKIREERERQLSRRHRRTDT